MRRSKTNLTVATTHTVATTSHAPLRLAPPYRHLPRPCDEPSPPRSCLAPATSQTPTSLGDWPTRHYSPPSDMPYLSHPVRRSTPARHDSPPRDVPIPTVPHRCDVSSPVFSTRRDMPSRYTPGLLDRPGRYVSPRQADPALSDVPSRHVFVATSRTDTTHCDEPSRCFPDPSDKPNLSRATIRAEPVHVCSVRLAGTCHRDSPGPSMPALCDVPGRALSDQRDVPRPINTQRQAIPTLTLVIGCLDVR